MEFENVVSEIRVPVKGSPQRLPFSRYIEADWLLMESLAFCFLDKKTHHEVLTSTLRLAHQPALVTGLCRKIVDNLTKTIRWPKS